MHDQKTRIFLAVSNHLLAQGRRSIKEDAGCAYRGGDDGELRCAVGCLISDENYDHRLEGKGSDFPSVRQAVEESIGEVLIEESEVLLSKLQALHDQHDTSVWPQRLAEMGKNL